MNWNQLEGRWEQVKAEAKAEWAKLTDDDLKFVSGKRDKLVGKLQERYGVLEERARRDVDDWFDRIGARIDRIGSGRDDPKRS